MEEFINFFLLSTTHLLSASGGKIVVAEVVNDPHIYDNFRSKRNENEYWIMCLHFLMWVYGEMRHALRGDVVFKYNSLTNQPSKFPTTSFKYFNTILSKK